MSDVTRVRMDTGTTPGQKLLPVAPQTPFAWIAIVVSLLALVSWFVLPLITMNYRDVYPVTDTWVMPAIATVLTDAAAVLGVISVWMRAHRSVTNVVAAVIMVLAALYATAMVVGEGLLGV